MMRKIKLIKEIDTVIAKNNELYSKCKELENLVNKNDTLIDSLKLQLEEVKAENEILRSDYFKPKQSTVVDDIDDGTVIVNNYDDENETEDVYSQSAMSNEKAYFKPLLNESVLKISSSAIGRVVLKSAELCNKFANDNNINSKDLINLALGRTEVFKSEVLELTTQDISEELLTAELNLKETEIIEYFELLLKQ